MSTLSTFIVRCGAPDCDWNCPMADIGKEAFDNCYSAFVKHCVAMHALKADGMLKASMHLDLKKWTLTLLK